VVGGTGGAGHARAARRGELDGSAADPTCAPLTSRMVPAPTPSASRLRVAVSMATGSPAASAKPKDAGIGA
jgi:hypothetical protein